MNTLFYKHKDDILINNLGPFGSKFYFPTTSFLYSKHLLEIQEPFRKKLYKLSGIKPYTNITYINASRKEQQFYIDHVQQFGKSICLDFNFKKISSPGIYENQEANNTNFDLNLNYKSKKGNYEVLFTNSIIRNFYQENGGLDSILAYEDELFGDARNYSVNLGSSNSYFKRYGYALSQRLDLYNFSSDSTNSNKIYLKHHFHYFTQQRVFYDNDPLSKIYNSILIDSTATIDSIYTNGIINTLSLGVTLNNFSMELFGQYDRRKYLQSAGIYMPYHNFYLGLRSEYETKLLESKMITKIGLDGYTEKDIESELFATYKKGKYSIEGEATYFLNEPDLKYVYYNSNHFSWENTKLNKQSVLDFRLKFRMEKLKLDFTLQTKLLVNALYFDSLSIANQYKGSMSMNSFALSKDYKLLNFYFRTAFIYQITSNNLLLPIPDIVGRQVVYYQKYMLKRALKFQFGIGFSYATGYYGYAYMPAINEFHVQRNTELGYYPSIDIFINTHLKRAQIFLKYEHINAGRSLDKSYMIPGYPPMDRSLKFGVSWNMFD